jgi:predicted transcriptional regulator YheO
MECVILMARHDLYKNKSWLHKRYVQDKKTPEEIAAECGCSQQTIYLYLNKFGLKMGRKGRR